MYVNDYALLASPVFDDRTSAGEELATELLAEGIRADIILGLTRGGVPVAAGVARALRAVLDIIVVKKIGAPFSLELAIGAVCSDGARVLHREYIRELGITDEYVERTANAMLNEARAAEERYRRGAPAIELNGKAVLLVDDGIATGSTVEAAIASARSRGARQVGVAVPVASPDSVERLEGVADSVFALRRPAAFFAVGQFYRDFAPVSDEEVARLVAEARGAPVR